MTPYVIEKVPEMPALCTMRKKNNSPKLDCRASPMFDPRYTVNATINTGRLPKRSAALPMIEGIIPETIRYAVTVRLMFSMLWLRSSAIAGMAGK